MAGGKQGKWERREIPNVQKKKRPKLGKDGEHRLAAKERTICRPWMSLAARVGAPKTRAKPLQSKTWPVVRRPWPRAKPTPIELVTNKSSLQRGFLSWWIAFARWGEISKEGYILSLRWPRAFLCWRVFVYFYSRCWGDRQILIIVSCSVTKHSQSALTRCFRRASATPSPLLISFVLCLYRSE